MYIVFSPVWKGPVLQIKFSRSKNGSEMRKTEATLMLEVSRMNPLGASLLLTFFSDGVLACSPDYQSPS